MPRFHATPDGLVQYTPEEEAQRDAEEALWAVNAEKRRLKEIRQQRDDLLAATDWTQAKDVSDVVSAKWAPYRQALRDVPQQAGFPDNITWPTKPE